MFYWGKERKKITNIFYIVLLNGLIVPPTECCIEPLTFFLRPMARFFSEPLLYFQLSLKTDILHFSSIEYVSVQANSFL